MRLLLLLIFLFACKIQTVDGFLCDLGASDLIYLVKASHLLDREAFINIKEFLKRFSSGLDLGRSQENTQVALILFDNINDPVMKIELSAYARFSDLSFAIDNLKKIPCGSSWCKEKHTGNRNALEFALKQFSPKSYRMKKVVIIHNGPGTSEDLYFQRTQALQDPSLKILEISVRYGVVTADNSFYNYYASYNDPYKRYQARYAQLYPNISMPQPVLPIPPDYGTQQENGLITVSDSIDILKLKDSVCSQIFACPVCVSETAGISEEAANTNDFGKSIQSGSSSRAAKSRQLEDYEYEIVGDSPSKKVNMKPVKDEVDVMRTTVSMPEYEYEDSEDGKESESPEKLSNENSSDLQKRVKRQSLYGSRKQSDCSCSATEVPVPQVFQMSTYSSVYRTPYYYQPRQPYSTPCHPFYPCVQQLRCFAPFYPNSCAVVPNRAYYYAPYLQNPNPVYNPVQMFSPSQPMQQPQNVITSENPENLLNDGSTIESLANQFEKLTASDSTIGDTSAEDTAMRRIDSFDPVLPDLLKPKPVSLDHLLSPLSSASSAFLTHGIQLKSEKYKTDHAEEFSNSATKHPNLSSKVKKPDGGSSLTHLDGLRSRSKRSYGYLSTPWTQPLFPPSSASWMPRNHHRVHGVSTYHKNQDEPMDCRIRGTDIAIYVDDVNVMIPSVFESVKSTVSKLYSLFENTISPCNQASRLSLMKTMPTEEVKTFLNFHTSITSVYENNYLLQSLPYGGCDIRKLRCESTLSNAVVIGSNSLTIENNDRQKFLVLISSRKKEEIKIIGQHLVQAQEFAERNNVSIIYVSTENGSKGLFSPTIRLESLISTICSLAPKLETLRTRSVFCPWI